MEVKDIKKAKGELENIIKEMVTDFNQKYGLPVETVEVEYTHSQMIVDKVNIRLESI